MRHCLYDCLVRHVFLFLLLLSVLIQATDEDPDVVVESDSDDDDSDGDDYNSNGDDDNSDGDDDDLDGPSCPLPGHKGILPKANTKGVITKEDLTLNQISEASTSPKFVLDVEARLSQRRMLNNRDVSYRFSIFSCP